MDCSLPGSSVHGILQARILERVAISLSRESPQPTCTVSPALAGRFFTTQWSYLGHLLVGYPFFFFFFPFIFISWRLIILQYCSGFCHESAMDLRVFPIPIPPPAYLPIPTLRVFPVHQPRAFVSCIQLGLVICFTLDSILVSMLFSQNIPPLHSPAGSGSLFCTSVSFFLFCI